MKYLALCVAGLQNVAWRQLGSELRAGELLIEEDGLLVFDADVPAAQLSSLSYLNNCFLVIHDLQAGTLSAAVRNLAKGDAWHGALRKSVTRNDRTFRLMLSDENRLVPGNRTDVARICSTIQRLTSMKLVPRGGGAEFWLMRRRSGRVFFCRRLTRRTRTEKDLRRGELRPELAHLMCLLSEPQPRDIFLDPMAGSGAIPFARTYYPYEMIFAFDREETHVRRIKSLAKDGKTVKLRKRSHLITHVGDARKLDRIEDGFIDKVVTDPPWGDFDRSLDDLGTFYAELLGELCRVTKVGGLVILLMGDRDMPAALTKQFAGALDLLETYPLLVAGKKAVVCKWRRVSVARPVTEE